MKRKIIKPSVLLIFLFSISAPAFANVKQIAVAPFHELSQLPSNSVQRIFQDREGFIWLGTNEGLCRYDGYHTLVFRSDINHPNLLADNEITSIAEDQNNLFVGTKLGLNILNKKNYSITHFDGEELKNTDIKCIKVASSGDIWVGTRHQLFRYSPDMSLVKKYDSSLPITSINSIYEDNVGNLWVCLWTQGLYKYNKEKDTFTRYPAIGKKNNPFAVFQDKENRYWIGTWWDGMYLFDPEQTSKDMYTYQDIKGIDSQFETRFFSIAQDNRYNYLWVVSNSGVRTLEITEKNELKLVNTDHFFKNHNNIFSEIIKDREGNLWIASFTEGVLTINFDKPILQNYTLSEIKEKTGFVPRISVIYEDKDKNIWMNQVRIGLSFFDTQKKQLYTYKDFPSLKDVFGMVSIRCISEFRSIPDEIWIGMESNSAIVSVKKDKDKLVFHKYIPLREHVKEPGWVLMFFEDSNNNIWIVTTEGLLIRKNSSNKIEPVDFSLGHITGIAESKNGSIWVSTRMNGIHQIQYTEESNTTEITNLTKENNSLCSNNIKAISSDRNGNIWYITKEENIAYYNSAVKTSTDLSHIFNVTGEGFLNVVADDIGHIWLSTGKRIIEYNPNTNTYRDYIESDGVVVNNFLPDSYFKSNSGKIFFGGNMGISAFIPSNNFSETPKKIRTYITDVKINNQTVFSGNNNLRLNIINQTLTLEPNDKNIEINFSSLNYSFPSKIKYAYKLAGVDEDWVYTDSERQFAIYNKIKKGKHTFYLKATDENGLWSSEINSFSIHKRPAFYETWGAFTIYFILLCITIYFAFRIVQNRVKLRNDLKIIQIEKEKAEELTQTKLRYFTNISHDFLTPLTIISCLIDDAEITYKGRITHLESMRVNISRLKRLLQQVLDFRKAESGNMKLNISYGDIIPFIKDICYGNFQPLMKKKNISFSFDAPEQILACFDADKTDKITYNILSNAFKYSNQHGKINVILETKNQNNHSYLTIRISDTGIGISPEDKKNIFTRFYTGKNGEKSETNGIGLSLTKDLLELHHGSINVESELGVGTTFSFTIPIDRESYSQSELDHMQTFATSKSYDYSQQAEIEEIPVNPQKEDKNILILLVEDNEELLSLMCNILSKSYSVLTAKNGLEALEVIKKHDINIVVSDVMMPEVDGLELTRVLKQEIETSHIPIILLTAKNSTEDRIECYNAGADGYISKPFELKILEARINNFIANKKEKQEEFKKNTEFNISNLQYQFQDEQMLQNAIKLVEDNITNADLNVISLSEKMHMSKSSFYRKIKTMTGLSPNEFIRNVRLKHACQLLKNQNISVAEVAYAVGFSDPKYFSVCFKNEFNMTPTDFQKQNT